MRRTALFIALLATISLASNAQNYVGASFTVKDAWDNVFRSSDQNRDYDLIGTYRGWDTTAVYIAAYNKSNSLQATQKIIIGNPIYSNNFMIFNLMNGHLGIGARNPDSKLVISEGNNGVSIHVGEISGIGFNRNVREGTIFNPNISGWQLTSRDDRFSIEGYNGAVFSSFNILKNGNVLIGKTAQTNSAYKLDVTGKVRADEITVNTTGADFVFEEGYNLRPLHEVEAFIKENRHLPDVAPAKAMQENGMSVGEMNAKLLQKVEELTLYLIEMKRTIEMQQQQIEKMDGKIRSLTSK